MLTGLGDVLEGPCKLGGAVPGRHGTQTGGYHFTLKLLGT